MQFKVWGKIDGIEFVKVFASVQEWRVEKRILSALFVVDVRGMQSLTQTDEVLP